MHEKFPVRFGELRGTASMPSTLPLIFETYGAHQETDLRPFGEIEKVSGVFVSMNNIESSFDSNRAMPLTSRSSTITGRAFDAS